MLRWLTLLALLAVVLPGGVAESWAAEVPTGTHELAPPAEAAPAAEEAEARSGTPARPGAAAPEATVGDAGARRYAHRAPPPAPPPR